VAPDADARRDEVGDAGDREGGDEAGAMKHHHHQTGVFSSAIPQIFSVIQEKLRSVADQRRARLHRGATSQDRGSADRALPVRGTWLQAFLAGWFLFQFSTRLSGSSV
jgi:hypothetical protein